MDARDEGYLRVGFLNVNSLEAHIGEIRQFLKDDPSYHLFGVAENKLGPKDRTTLSALMALLLSDRIVKSKAGE